MSAGRCSAATAPATTLLQLLAARRFPTSGTVDVLGCRLGRVPVHELWPRIGQVSAGHTPAGRLTARQVVLTGQSGTAALPLHRRPAPALLERVDELCSALVLAAGPAAEVLASGPLSDCYGLSLQVRRDAGRWSARSR